LQFDELTDIEETAAKWLENPTAMRGIRHIVVYSTQTEGSMVVDVEDIEQWRKFLTFIEKAARLRTLTWKPRLHIPLHVLQALEKYHPTLQLKVYNYTRTSQSGDANHPAELALASTPLLVGINAKIYLNYANPRHDLREVALRRIISQSPNLKYVSVFVDQSDRSGHKVASSEQKDPFYKRCTPNSKIRNLTLDGYRLSKETLEDWSYFVDLSTLENFKCLRGGEPKADYFARALKVMFNIKHVSLNLRFNNSKEFRAAVENYLSLCPTLESLSLWSWVGRVNLSTILRHGPTLQVLQLHEREEGSFGRLPAITAENVRSIREACPHLRDLTIDMRRESRNLLLEEKNDEICDEIALFGPQLDKVQIYFDLGIASIWSGTFNRRADQGDSSSDEDDEDSDEEERPAIPEDSDDSDEEHEEREEGPTIRIIKPSKARWIERRVEEMWQIMFGERTTGARQLDVKVCPFSPISPPWTCCLS
jgi:hypothetical protein